jgi:hypothetical protein
MHTAFSYKKKNALTLVCSFVYFNPHPPGL